MAITLDPRRFVPRKKVNLRWRTRRNWDKANKAHSEILDKVPWIKSNPNKFKAILPSFGKKDPKWSLIKPKVSVDDFLAGNNKKKNVRNKTLTKSGGMDLNKAQQTKDETEQEYIKDNDVKCSINDVKCGVEKSKTIKTLGDIDSHIMRKTIDDTEQEDREYGECITNNVKFDNKDDKPKEEEIKQNNSDGVIKIDSSEKGGGNNSEINEIFEQVKKYKILDSKIKEEIKQEKVKEEITDKTVDNINIVEAVSSGPVTLTDGKYTSSTNSLKRKYESDDDSDSQLTPEQKFLVTKMCLENQPISVSNLSKKWRCSLHIIQNWVEDVRGLLLKSNTDTSQFFKKRVTDSENKTSCDYCNIVCATRDDFERHLHGTTHKKTMKKIYKFR